MKTLLLIFTLFLFPLIIGTSAVTAQTYPSRPIQLVIAGAPGDGIDTAGRAAAEELSKILKVPVIPLNKPGGAGTIGAAFAMNSPKDGYTLHYGSSQGLIIGPSLRPAETPYQPLRDFEHLGFHVFFPLAISVQTEAPWKTFAEFIDYARKNPGKLRCGTIGGIHLQLETVKYATGVDIAQVPFKGSSQTITALLGGHIESTFIGLTITYPHIESGKLRPLLVDEKVPQLPHVPSWAELGYKENLHTSWFGFLAPAGIPEEARKVLVPAIEKAIRNPELVARLQKFWFITRYMPPEEFRRMHKVDYDDALVQFKRLAVNP
jgi:tripartite-type tricarboxylate transporter receptor subunit TctC